MYGLLGAIFIPSGFMQVACVILRLGVYFAEQDAEATQSLKLVFLLPSVMAP